MEIIMKKNCLLYLMISLSITHQLLCLDLSDIVQNNKFSDVAKFREEFLEQLKEKPSLFETTSTSYLEVQKDVNSAFVEPISNAIETKKYDLAYYLIEESRFSILGSDQKDQKYQVNLLSKNSSDETLLKLILASNDASLKVLANAWVAEQFIQHFEFIVEGKKKPVNLYQQFIEEEDYDFKKFINDLTSNGLNLDELKKIIIEALVITSNKDLSKIFEKLKETGIDLQAPNEKQKVIAEKNKIEAKYKLIKSIGTSRYVEAISEFLATGSDINGRDIRTGDTILISAIKSKSKGVQELIDHHPDVNLWGASKKTPLMAAVHTKNLNLIQQLLNNGADLNAQDIFGQTALIHILKDVEQDVLNIKKGIVEKSTEAAENIIKELLKKGARDDVKDVFGYTALDYAKETKNPKIIASMEKGVSTGRSDISNLEELTEALKQLSAYSSRL
jgi:ankyrin repeat protein